MGFVVNRINNRSKQQKTQFASKTTENLLTGSNQVLIKSNYFKLIVYGLNLSHSL